MRVVPGRARRFIGLVIIVVAAVFLIRALVEGWGRLRDYEWSFEPLFLSLSIAFILLYYAQQWGGWRLVMKSFGDPLKLSESLAIWFASILGRYAPGKVAMVAGRVGLCQRRGIPGRVTFASMVYENALILISALLFVAATVPFWPPFEYKGYALALAAFAPLGLIPLHPAIFSKISNFLLSKFKREPLEEVMPLGRVALLLVYYVGGWTLLGAGFAALSAAISGVSWGDVALLAGGYAFAWEVGFLSFITPSGLGVKEVALLAVLALVLPGAIAAALVVLSRMWQTLAEVALAALVWSFAKGKDVAAQR